MRNAIAVALLTSALGAGCADEGTTENAATSETATASLQPKSDNKTLAGTARFEGAPGNIKLTLDVSGAPAGEHGVHIHEKGDCSSADAMSAGGHWNPNMSDHAAPGPSAHLGDLGNMTVGADGKGSLSASNAQWEIGTGSPKDLIGKALIVHTMPDDLMTQPTGNAGGRIGCGEIK